MLVRFREALNAVQGGAVATARVGKAEYVLSRTSGSVECFVYFTKPDSMAKVALLDAPLGVQWAITRR